MPDKIDPNSTIYNDPTGQKWSLNELQALVIHVSLNKAAKRLGMKSTRQLRKWGLKTPTEVARERAAQNPNWLLSVIIRRGTVGKAADYLNVSKTFITGLLTEAGITLQDPEPPAEDVRLALAKFGSPIIVARLFDTTVTIIKKLVPDWRDLKDPTKAGDHSVRTGHIAEQYYKRLRIDFITASPSEQNHNNKGFDFIDSQFGKINVKGTVINSNNGWTWELKPDTECESFALVQMDKDKKPLGVVVIPMKALTIDSETGDLRRSVRQDGKIAFSTRRLFSAPPLTYYYVVEQLVDEVLEDVEAADGEI
jgi:hypothetical protein